MIILTVSNSLEQIKLVLDKFKDDVCIIITKGDFVKIVTFENILPQIDDKCKIVENNRFTVKENVDLLFKIDEDSCVVLGNDGLINSIEL
jgi:hypothetical protein